MFYLFVYILIITQKNILSTKNNKNFTRIKILFFNHIIDKTIKCAIYTVKKQKAVLWQNKKNNQINA